MCDNVIIHNADGTETVCECQEDLMKAMPQGLSFIPPPTPAEIWDCYKDRMYWVYKREGKLGISEARSYYKPEVLDAPYPLSFVPSYQDPLDLHDPLKDLEKGYHPSTCLCPVDLKKTATTNGFEARRILAEGEWDAFDTHFYPEE